MSTTRRVRSATIGYPRIGLERQLKEALEGFWSDELTEDELLERCRTLRKNRWRAQAEAGIDLVPSNDFSMYDHVLDTACTVGAIPERYDPGSGEVSLDTYFAMARGRSGEEDERVEALEMTKWFDTNYHYIVPKLARDQDFEYRSNKAVRAHEECSDLGIDNRPVLLGPVSFLMLSKADGNFSTLELLDDLVAVYGEVVSDLEAAGAEELQMDEPCLVTDLCDEEREAYRRAYRKLDRAHDLETTLTPYFGELRDNLTLALDLPVDGLHLDLVRGGELEAALDRADDRQHLSLGLIDGRNIWRSDLDALLQRVQTAVDALGAGRVQVAPSCSLLFVPLDVERETHLDDELRSWLAFAHRKLEELDALATAANRGREAAAETFEICRAARESRRESPRTSNPDVDRRVEAVDESMARRDSPFSERKSKQQALLDLPKFPTTTIGSSPQRSEIRTKRAAYKRGDLAEEAYESFIADEIERTIRAQEEIGLDLLVHGESERSDMVEYFGQQLSGFAFTDRAWVQSYGSRCVRPPIIYGDVEREEPMTVDWLTYADDLTDRPLKGILTGPVTMVQWSFVRDDQSRSETARQIALAIRDEVADLEEAGIPAIQVDEPALREGLPLRKSDWDEYLDWAVETFRLTTCVVDDRTQIQTHMCYSDFADIIESVAELDADALFIEASRSDMELLEVFDRFEYPNDIGPGVYDIHSPRVPSTEEMYELLEKAVDVVDSDKLWVVPDCGLKTRNWDEVRPSLSNMVEAAEKFRDR